MNNFLSYLGSRFDENINKNIDPKLLDIDQGQRAVRAHQAQQDSLSSPNHDPFTPRSSHDFRPDFAAGPQWQHSLPNRRATLDNDRSNHPGLYRASHPRPGFPVTPPSTINSQPTPRHRRLRELQEVPPPSYSTNHDREGFGRPTRSWQQNNPFALLDPDLGDPLAYGATADGHGAIENQLSLPQHPVRPSQNEPFPDFDYCMPATEPIPQPPMPNYGARSNGNATISSESLSRLPVNRHSNETMGQWNRETFQIVGAIPLQGQAPPTPTPSGRHGRRPSRAPSVTSTQAIAFICDICHKGFDKWHKLNHHSRWHDDPTHICESCGKRFVARKDLRRHEKTHKKEERHLFCNIMGCKYHQRGFQRPDHLKRHIERMHRGSLLSQSPTSSFAGG